MTDVNYTSYLNEVKSNYIENLKRSNDEKIKISSWFDHYVIEKKGDSTEMEKVAHEILTAQNLATKKRYQFSTISKNPETDRLLKHIFDTTFKTDREKVISALEAVIPKDEKVFPKWKKVMKIDLPKKTAAFFGHPVTKIAVAVAVIALTAIALFKLYAVSSALIVAKVVPIIVSLAPAQVLRAGALFIEGHAAFLKYSLLIFIAVAGVTIALRRLQIPYVSNLARRINLLQVFLFLNPLALGQFIAGKAFDLGKFTWNISSKISSIASGIAIGNENKRALLYKTRCFDVWKQATAAAA